MILIVLLSGWMICKSFKVGFGYYSIEFKYTSDNSLFEFPVPSPTANVPFSRFEREELKSLIFSDWHGVFKTVSTK